ncbi:MAG: hypothetical protein ACRDJ1_06395 [Actinomycetota bacterium]
MRSAILIISLAVVAGSMVLVWLASLRISGVPMLERRLRRTKPGYEDYARRTSALFPLPPRRRSDGGMP